MSRSSKPAASLSRWQRYSVKESNAQFLVIAVGTRESWLKTPRNRELAVNFRRAFSEGLTLAKKDSGLTKKVMRKYARLNDEAVLQASFEFYRDQFPQTLRVDERSYANLLRYLDHPKAATADPKEFFDNGLINDILAKHTTRRVYPGRRLG